MSSRVPPTIFLTGATGAIGSRVLEDYLVRGSEVYVLARGRDGAGAEDRIRLLLEQAKLPAELRRHVHVLEGSIEEPDFGLSSAERNRVVRATDFFVHSAAVTHLGATADECHRSNVLGTRHALELAEACRREGRLQRFGYLSSYAASGTARSAFLAEDTLPEHPHFANHYERTKYKAEQMAREHFSRGLPVVVFRPSVTVGDSKTGRISSFNLFYQVIRVLGSGMLSHWPDLRERKVNIIPVDYVARAIRRGLKLAWALGRSFHLVSRNGCLLRDLYEILTALPYHRIPKFVPLAQWSLNLLSQKEQMLHRRLEAYLLPYLNDLRLETVNSERLIELPVIHPSFLRRLLQYAVEAGYLPPEVFPHSRLRGAPVLA
ncbi:MAG: SDR family oxidoreductase [Acidobacteria bacterium]|nr:SDR family oxidoreductase [Acidobacteriota bacterium]